MRVWGALLGTLGWNYLRHRHGRSTLCSSGRKTIPAWAFCLGWGILTGWLIPHFCKGNRNG